MSLSSIPLLWLFGPPGVGKSTVGWRLFTQLSAVGTRTGYLDIDQLGMLYPEPPSDPDRHDIKARNLGAMVDTFHAAGARCVVVSGVVDPVHGARDYVDRIPRAIPTLCRLRADVDDLRARLAVRNLESAEVGAILEETAQLDRSDFADATVDTSGKDIAEVVRLVESETRGWPCSDVGANADGFDFEAAAPSVPPGQILWLCGAPGVGKSAVGWHVFDRCRRSGVTTAFLDLEQIGFCRPAEPSDPDNHRVKARNLATMWRNFHDSGAKGLVVVGSVDDNETVAAYRAALPGVELTVCRLNAGPNRLRERIRRRADGSGPRLAGDDLVGKPVAFLDRVAERSAAKARDLRKSDVGDLVVDTDDRSADEVARVVEAMVELDWVRFSA